MHAQLIAFPGAEGAGKFTSGGRGTPASPSTVYEVTNLGDVNAAGSLRYAATVSGPVSRIIVFRVAGTIHLNSSLTLNRANTTIAGQTAPGEGICIADYPVYLGANNLIIRYLRFRLGDKNQNGGMVNGSGGDDAFGDNGNGRQKLIIDHCTAGWSDDESLTIYKGDSVTIQWCMIAEPLNYSYHFETGDPDFEQHAYGGIWGGKHASFHHNLFAHIKGRAPRFDGIRNIVADSGDFRNNVIYNWSDYNTNGGEGGAYNVVNNYYKYGPSTLNSSTSGVNRRNMLINPYKQTSPAIPYGRYYLTGNYCDNSSTVTNDNWLGAAFSSGSFNDSISSKATVPFNCININMQTAQDAYTSVLANAGCTLPHRDTLDQRIMNDVINRTGKIIDVQGGYPHGTAYFSTVNAWPALASGFSPIDSDHDGMPDAWEIQRGLNPASAADLNGYISTSGYPNIENYLNGDTIVAPGILNSCITTRTITASNSGSWLFANDTSYNAYTSPLYLSSTDSNNVAAAILDNGNFGNFSITYFTTGTIRNDLLGHPYLNRNITITPANPGLIISPVTVRVYFSQAEYNALKASDPTITGLQDLRIVKVPSNDCNTAVPGPAQIIVPSASGIFGTYQNGYFLEFSASSFSTFFIASSNAAGPLPMRLISFTGYYSSGSVHLAWQTENEFNQGNYLVERSFDGRNFLKISSVPSKNSLLTNDYVFNDADLQYGKLYYRLKMMDRDGSFKYSPIIAVKKDQMNGITVYPDPAVNEIVIIHPKTGNHSVVRIISADGKMIAYKPLSPGVTQTVADASGLEKGMYMLVIIDENGNMLKSKFFKP